jgi:signal transduction histidine kinase
MLGHELRTPLAGAHMTLQLVRRHTTGSPPLPPLLDRIERQLVRMARLVDDLQDISRITRGRLSLRCDPLDLAALVCETVEDQRAAFEARRVSLDLALPEGPTLVNGDADRLAQVLVNLLDNALKFTDPEGRVTVTVTVVVRRQASGVRRQASGLDRSVPTQDARPTTHDLVAVTVRDTGIGIAPETRARLFESFVQAEHTLERSRGGLGLGLALVRGLVELHGGSVHVASEGIGRGAEFTFQLPLAAGVPDR